MMVTTSPTEYALDARHRCDACGAQAYVRADFASGPLYFCAHHAKKHSAGLAKAITVRDETGRLMEGAESR